MTRERHFRWILVRLECGCWNVLPTSLYRIEAVTKAMIIGHAVRTGVWCRQAAETAEGRQHRGAQMIQEVGETVRLE